MEMIAKVRYVILSSVPINNHKSLILPNITYWLTAWGNLSEKYIVNKIVVLQKQVLHLIYFTDKKEHAIPLFINAKILHITILYYEAVCKLMLNVHNSSALSNIMNLSLRTLNNYTYILLAHQHHNSLGWRTLGFKIWNEMPSE